MTSSTTNYKTTCTKQSANSNKFDVKATTTRNIVSNGPTGNVRTTTVRNVQTTVTQTRGK